MGNILLGIILTAGLFLVVDYSKRRNLQVKWWQWALTILGFVYVGFVLAAIGAFLAEGSARGALTMGLITGLVAVIWGVLLGRFVFVPTSK